MYPFPNRSRWLIANRQLHLVAAIERKLGAAARRHPVIAPRLRAIRKWLKLRAVVLVLLYMNVVAATASVLLSRIPESDAVISLLNQVAGVTSTLAFLFIAGLLVIGRFLGQHEMDLLAYLLLEQDGARHAPTQPTPKRN